MKTQTLFYWRKEVNDNGTGIYWDDKIDEVSIQMMN